MLTTTHDLPTARILLSGPACTALCALADHYAEAGNLHQALVIYQELLSKVMSGKPDVFDDLRDTPKLSDIYRALSNLYRRSGDLPKAEAMKSKRIELWRHWQHTLPQNIYVRNQLKTAEQDY